MSMALSKEHQQQQHLKTTTTATTNSNNNNEGIFDNITTLNSFNQWHDKFSKRVNLASIS